MFLSSSTGEITSKYLETCRATTIKARNNRTNEQSYPQRKIPPEARSGKRNRLVTQTVAKLTCNKKKLQIKNDLCYHVDQINNIMFIINLIL